MIGKDLRHSLAIKVRVLACTTAGQLVAHVRGKLAPKPIAVREEAVRRMEAAGRTLCVKHPPLVTSSRRFRGRHPIAIVFGWVRIHLLFYLGVAPQRLARIYDNERRRERRTTPRTDA